MAALDLPDWLSFDETNLTLYGTPSEQHLGQSTFTLVATDQTGLQTVSEHVISVNEVNDLPIISYEARDWYKSGENFAVAVSVSDEETENPDLELIHAPTFLQFDQTTGQLFGSPSLDDVGNHQVTLKAIDGNGGETEEAIEISIVEKLPKKSIAVIIDKGFSDAVFEYENTSLYDYVDYSQSTYFDLLYNDDGSLNGYIGEGDADSDWDGSLEIYTDKSFYELNREHLIDENTFGYFADSGAVDENNYRWQSFLKFETSSPIQGANPGHRDWVLKRFKIISKGPTD